MLHRKGNAERRGATRSDVAGRVARVWRGVGVSAVEMSAAGGHAAHPLRSETVSVMSSSA